jgi:pyruvate,water dikinase
LNGQVITVSCASGDTGYVFSGELAYEQQEIELGELTRPKTQIMVNIGNPDLAFRTAMLPNDGVGLARTEFIISEYVKAHPMALAHPERIYDLDVRQRILDLTVGFEDPSDYFVSRLTEGVATIAAASYPKPVIVRLSDFKSNEYANLLGGSDFELPEANPMLGLRGASRYTHPSYEDGVALDFTRIISPSIVSYLADIPLWSKAYLSYVTLFSDV